MNTLLSLTLSVQQIRLTSHPTAIRTALGRPRRRPREPWCDSCSATERGLLPGLRQPRLAYAWLDFPPNFPDECQEVICLCRDINLAYNPTSRCQ